MCAGPVLIVLMAGGREGGINQQQSLENGSHVELRSALSSLWSEAEAETG